eukprot:CAMPEP_0169083812 /NCGR_PEP_ID=MMETSP1015-20121227/12278_1 /TAXON_ID=342587 /ORGANISM="Karlodinium micrum, Strain CCMP2283" /LENGTH=235 /DNA_ID=CAMNT_0009143761 /DNA_START=81 /DNA_END=789 /DNA_ORIENTATION=+
MRMLFTVLVCLPHNGSAQLDSHEIDIANVNVDEKRALGLLLFGSIIPARSLAQLECKPDWEPTVGQATAITGVLVIRIVGAPTVTVWAIRIAEATTITTAWAIQIAEDFTINHTMEDHLVAEADMEWGNHTVWANHMAWASHLVWGCTMDNRMVRAMAEATTEAIIPKGTMVATAAGVTTEATAAVAMAAATAVVAMAVATAVAMAVVTAELAAIGQTSIRANDCERIHIGYTSY